MNKLVLVCRGAAKVAVINGQVLPPWASVCLTHQNSGKVFIEVEYLMVLMVKI